jgi:hypothetical protein
MLRYISYFLLLIFCTSAQAVEVEIASKRYLIEIDGVKTFLPYESSHNLSSKHDSITRVIYSIHSASYNAKSYFNSATALVDKVSGQKNKTLIIAPHILDKSCLDKPEDQNILYWEIPAFRGTSRGFFKDKRITVSAFEVTDMILEDVATRGNFPNLKTIIILGHSAGGQMVNRYAASGIFETKIANPMGIEVRYIVMAPSSYVYFNNERVIEGTISKFSIPKSPPQNYNHWGYGLERMYVYHKKYKVTPEFVIDQYPSKRILYLVGSKDRNKNDPSMGRGKAAMLQGRHRLERGIIYYNYLFHFFGEQVKQTQHFRVIKGAGHSGRSLMLSPQAMEFTFSPNSKKRVGSKNI